MRGRLNLHPKTIDLNINIEESQSRYGSTPLESFRQDTNHRQQNFPQQAFIKNERNQDKNDKENTNCFSNIVNSKKKVLEQTEFNSTLKKEDDSYIKTLRGMLKKELFKKEKLKIIVINESKLKAKTHLGDLETTLDEEEKLTIMQNFNKKFLFELKNCKKILLFLGFMDLLNFQFICKRTFSSEFKSFIKSKVCTSLIKVPSIKLIGLMKSFFFT